MINSIKHLAVNWVDGMKISQKHFDAHSNFVIDSLRDVGSINLNMHNYGLLPVSGNVDGKSIFDIYNTATNDVQLVIKQCSAVTPAGYRIELSDYTTNIKSLTNSVKDQENNGVEDFFIVISVNPFDKKPCGDVDLEETPPRHPHTLPSYHIELLPASSFQIGTTGGNYIVIGKVLLQNNIVEADINFIPPCTNLFSHPSLLNYYNSFAKSMSNIQQYAVKIIQKNISISQNTKLATNVKFMCETLITHIGNVYFKYRNIVPQQSPIYMVDVFAQQALHLFNTTQSINALELEEMLNYIYEWSEIAPHTLLNQLSAVTEINYNHNNCGNHLIEIQKLLNSLEIIFVKLSELDYIGQRKENIIVNEQDVTPVSKNKRGWSVLD